MVRYVCPTCGESNIVWDAWAQWDEQGQEFCLAETFEEAFCETCEGATSPDRLEE